MQTLPPPRDVVLEQLDRMLASDTFAGAERSRALLRFLVEHVVADQSDRLKEYTIGSEALGRGDSFDPRTDPIVRAEASRLRTRLERYYATDGVADAVLIALPKGSYVPQLQTRAAPEPAPMAATAGDRDSTPARLQRLIWFVLGGLAVGAAVVFFVWVRGHETSTSELGALRPDRRGTDLVEFDVELAAADRSLGSDWGNDVIISPDGTRVVFVARGSDHVLRLMTMVVGQPRSVVELRETEGARAPFFSPDSRWVGFWDQAKLKTVSVDGGSPVDLTDARDFRGASWGSGDIIAAIDDDLWRVSETSGEAAPVTTGLTNDRNQRVVPWWPHLLPGGTHVLFTAMGPEGADGATIEVLSLADGTRTPLVRGGTFARYLPDGYLLYVNQGTLFSVQFDLQQLAVRGARVPVLDERVAYSPIFGFAQFDVARDGRLIYRSSPPLVPSWLERSGKVVEPLPLRPGAYSFPRLSPDGQRLAINVTDGGMLRLDLYHLGLNQTTRLPFAPGSTSAVWHPDGFLVAGGMGGMSWTRDDDMWKVETLTRTPNVQIPSSFSADRTRLAYMEAAPNLNLWTIPVSHSGGRLTAGEPEPFVQTQYIATQPSFSPGDRWVAYGWGPQGHWDVYVRPFPPDASQPIKVSREGGRVARWLPNGRELVYRTDDHRLMVVDYQVKNGAFIPGTPTEWTSVRLGDTGVLPNFDIDPSGARILGLVPAAPDEERVRNQVTVMPRFADEVRRRLTPGGR
jgi:eukaryotic-like serine/threonine-protein kinase